jgi:hypothetical protein
MDAFTINLDMASKSGSFTSSLAIGAYTQIALSVYNFRAPPDLATLDAKVYADTGTVLSTCTTFVADGTVAGQYNATLSLSTDTAIAYFSTKKPSFVQDLTIVLSDSTTLYCNARIQVKNNPNGIPVSPTPVTTWFIMKSDEGFTYDLEGADEVMAMTDSMTAAQVRRGLITLVKYLRGKGVV